MPGWYDDADYEPSGDPRRCPVHRHVVTSSADGLHDAPCGECEAAGDVDDVDTEHALALLEADADPIVVSHLDHPLYRDFDDDIPF